MKDRTFFNWLIMLLALVALTGFCFTPAFAEIISPDGTVMSEDDFMLEESGEDLEILDDSFGEGYQYTWIPAEDFAPYSSDTRWNHYTAGYKYFTSTNSAFLNAGINLPSGAYLYYAQFYFYDNHSGNVSCYIYRYTTSNTSTLLNSWTSSGTPGYYGKNMMLYHTIKNGDGSYAVFMGASDASINLRIKGMRLCWKRQISPAPATASFGDVPTNHWAFQKIEALAASGITSGCGGGNFCPDQAVTRAQMAVFLAKALGLHWGPLY